MKSKVLVIVVAFVLCLMGCGSGKTLTADQVNQQLDTIKGSGVLEMSEEPYWYHISLTFHKSGTNSDFQGIDVVKLEGGYYISQDMKKYTELSEENANALYIMLQQQDLFTLVSSDYGIAGGEEFTVFCEFNDGTMKMNSASTEAIPDPYTFTTVLKDNCGYKF